MKKFWKIFGITLGSLLGVVLIAALIIVYMVLTPKRLTPIVSNVVDRYVTSPHQIGDVELTFFSTFPRAGVKLNSVLVMSEMQGAQSDTLLYADNVVAKLDWKKYLNDKVLDVEQLSLNNVKANIFINEAGEGNYNVLALEKDTIEDTTAFSLPFNELYVDRLSLEVSSLSFLSLKDSISAALANLNLDASAKGMDDINLSLLSAHSSVSKSGEQWLTDRRLLVESKHTGVDIENMHFLLPDASVAIDDFTLKLTGDATISDDISLKAHVDAKEWDIPSLLQLLPSAISDKLQGIVVDKARMSVLADVQGVYNDSLMPVVDASLSLADGQASYMQVFPYQLTDINLEAQAHVDINRTRQSVVTLKSLTARTGKTTIAAEGEISEFLDDALLDLRLSPDVQLSEFKRYLASEGKQTDMSGRASGKVSAKIRLSDLSKKQLSKGQIKAQLSLKNIDVVYDSIIAHIPQSALTLTIPNNKPSRKTVGWAQLQLTPESMQVEMIDKLKADLGKTDVQVEVSDVLKTTESVAADVSLSSSLIEAQMDSMGGKIAQPKLRAAVDYNSRLSEDLRLQGDADLSFDKLEGFYDDIKAQLTTSSLKGSMKKAAGNKLGLELDLTTATLDAAKAEELTARTGNLKIKAGAVRDKTKDNLLLQWNPQLSVRLSDGHAQLANLTEKIQVPHISFDYSNHLFDIADSRIVLGNSDFTLKGQVRNIGDWLEDKGVLKGELDFRSQHTDVNELMALTSADSGTEETEPEEPEEKSKQVANGDEKKAYLVPKNVDITLRTDITEALVFDQVARELGGQLYIKDGVLVLEEMGFICNAAKLQLTAIYKTPRRNHIYVGLDYHMMDIDMQELVNMIPQIDTMMPMLRSFRGEGEFHLAAETYVNDKYQLKTSTTRGACSITGKDLILLDSETFGKISKILLFNRKTENKVDSISAQATLFKKEIDIYPFCITMDKYMAAVGGRHNLDMSFDYHISLLKPLYIGVDVKGTLDDLQIKPAKCKYAQDFRPIIRRDVETQNQTLKKMIDQALKRNVKE